MDDHAERARVKALIAQAFAGVERPGNWALVGSLEGDEPARLAAELQDRTDWRLLDAAFLDQLPDGYGSALSFFSDEAFRYFLPAYLIADLDGALRVVDPTFHLFHGLDDATHAEPVNPRRYGERTWLHAQSHRFSTFTRTEAAAIVAYLRYKAAHDDFARPQIEQAIARYWGPRAA